MNVIIKLLVMFAIGFGIWKLLQDDKEGYQPEIKGECGACK